MSISVKRLKLKWGMIVLDVPFIVDDEMRVEPHGHIPFDDSFNLVMTDLNGRVILARSDADSSPPKDSDKVIALLRLLSEYPDTIVGDLIERTQAIKRTEGLEAAERWFWRAISRTIVVLFWAALRSAVSQRFFRQGA